MKNIFFCLFTNLIFLTKLHLHGKNKNINNNNNNNNKANANINNKIWKNNKIIKHKRIKWKFNFFSL